MSLPVFHPKVKKIIAQCERRIKKLTENSCISVMVLNLPGKPIPYEDIERIVCEVTGIPIEFALQESRQYDRCVTRQLIAFFAKSNCKMSYKSIAEKLGRKDHTAIISSLRRIKHLVESGDTTTCKYIKDINQRILQLKSSV